MPQRFRVALSFPGEHREVVKAVADKLVEKLGEGTVFYDAYFEYALARPNVVKRDFRVLAFEHARALDCREMFRTGRHALDPKSHRNATRIVDA